MKKEDGINRRDFLGCAAGAAAAVTLGGCDAGSGQKSCSTKSNCKKRVYPLHKLAPAPPLGWNSFDCWGNVATEKAVSENLEVFAKRLKPYGYEYFVFDAGWYSEYKSAEMKNARQVRIDEYGRYLPSKYWLPNGLQPQIDRAHELGVKYGLWLIRGVSRKAVELNLPIKGTKYRARDIAKLDDVCWWFDCNYGIDASKPGAQEYYNSIFELLAEWKIDFVKYDNIVQNPEEIDLVANACENCGRDMVLSLSPGTHMNKAHMETYRRSNMLRMTYDMWDRKKDIVNSFDRWEMFQDFGGDGFYMDLDMIPFGHLLVWRPSVPGQKVQDMLGGMGFSRMDEFTAHQKRTFMSQRALAASPLFMGGDLPTSDELSFELITNKGMLECNQNGVTGKLIWRYSDVDVWHTPHKTKANHGWFGVFNRHHSKHRSKFSIKKCELGLKPNMKYKLYDIWQDKTVKDKAVFDFDMISDEVALWRYEPA